MRIIRLMLAILLAAIFIYSGVAKIQGIEAFEIYLYRSSFLSFDTASVAARLMIGLEWLIAIGLLSRIRYKFTWWLAMLTTVVFSIFLVQQLIFGEGENCHCFGELLPMNAGQSLVKNLVFLIALILIRPLRSLKFKYSDIIGSILAIAIITVPLVLSPPDIFVKGRYDEALHDQEVLDDLVKIRVIPPAFVEGRNVLAFYSTGCKFCRLSSERMAGLFIKNKLDRSRMRVVFMGASSSTAEFYQETNSPEFEYCTLTSTLFLQVTMGRMPLILLVDDGEIVEAINYRTIDEKVITDFLNEEG